MNRATPSETFELFHGTKAAKAPSPAYNSNVRRLMSSTSMLLALSACGGGGGVSEANSASGSDTIATSKATRIGISNDPFIDGLTFGYKYNANNISYAVSGGLDGEYWINPEETLDYFGEIINSTLKYTNLRATQAGVFDNPEAAGKAGVDLNLIPYITNSYNVSYFTLGFAFPVAAEKIFNADFDYMGQEGDIYINFGGILGNEYHRMPFTPGSEGYLLILHELGHSLGLKHPHDSVGDRLSFNRYDIHRYDLDEYTVMSYNDDSNSYVLYDPSTPMILDVIALQYLYGKNLSLNAGDTIHQIYHTGIYYTIWDPSGIDTLDFSISQHDWIVELPSVVSSPIHGEYVGYALEDNGASAPNDLVWLIGNIENILGGSGNDVFFGNHLSNTINGGAGDDWIEAGAGNDVLIGGSGFDTFVVCLNGGFNTIKDFELNIDSWIIFDGNRMRVFETYSELKDESGCLFYRWSDGTTLTFENLFYDDFFRDDTSNNDGSSDTTSDQAAPQDSTTTGGVNVDGTGAVNSRETEPNDNNANRLMSGTAITGQTSTVSDKDWFYLALDTAGTITVSFDDGDGNTYSDHDISIIDASGNILSKKSIYTAGTITAEVVTAGDYFVLVENSYDTEDYTLMATIL